LEQGSRGLPFILFVAFLLLIPGIVQANALGSSTSLDEEDFSYVIEGASQGIQWKIDDLFYGEPALAPDGTTYVLISWVDDDNIKRPVALRALNEDGSKKWQVPIDGLCTDPVVDQQGNIYISTRSENTYDSELIRFDDSGSIDWRYNMSQRFPGHWELVLSQPVVHPNGNVVVAIYNRVNPDGENSTLCSIDNSGELDWSLEVVSTIRNVYIGPLLDSMIYVTNYQGVVQGIEVNGSLAWTLDLQEDKAYIGSPSLVGNDGNIYMPVGKFDDETQDRNWSQPQEIWCVAMNGSVVMKTSLFVEHNILYNCNIMLTDITAIGTIYCLNTNGYGADANGSIDRQNIIVPSRALALSPQGEIIWNYSLTTDRTFYSNALLTASSMYLFPIDTSEIGEIMALNPDNGSLLGTFAAPNKLWLDGVAAGSGDRFLYLEGTYEGAEEGFITLVSTNGLPQAPVERPLDLTAATVAWGSIFGLMVGGGYYATHKKRN
jgi:hypothetical protein